MKLLTICMLGLMGCAGTTAAPGPQKTLLNNTPAPAVVAPQVTAPALPTAEELEKIAFENDRNSAISFANEMHKTMVSSMELPQGTETKQQIEEVVFADERAVAVVRMKATFILHNQVVDEVMVSLFIVKVSASGSWMFKSLAARPTKEMILRRMKALQQSQEQEQEQEDSNGTKL